MNLELEQIIATLNILQRLTKSTLRDDNDDAHIAMLELIEGTLPPIIFNLNTMTIKHKE